MALVYAAPYVPVAPPRLWEGLQMTWTGWDGSLWNLTTIAHGAVMMAGVRGLSMPPVQHYLTTYASVDGARWRGNTIEPREVFWPIQIFHDASSQAWIDRERAFWRTMRPGKTGVWTVILPSGEKRHLDCRFSDDSQQAFNLDPVAVGWNNYGINLVAHQPFWRGERVRNAWKSEADPIPFFPTEEIRHFTISPSNGLSDATVTNPGDVVAYPVWEVYGPCLTAHVGIYDELIEIPFAVDAGKVLIIDTAPTAQTAFLYSYTGTGPSRVLSDPVDKISALGAADFCPLPADDTTAVNLIMDGTGSMAVEFTPHYLRAW
jgi:hypothetical protein